LPIKAFIERVNANGMKKNEKFDKISRIDLKIYFLKKYQRSYKK
jgi:hypothetical protein